MHVVVSCIGYLLYSDIVVQIDRSQNTILEVDIVIYFNIKTSTNLDPYLYRCWPIGLRKNLHCIV